MAIDRTMPDEPDGLHTEIEERMEAHRERSRQRRRVFRRQLDLDDRYPGFGRLPAPLMARVTRWSLTLDPEDRRA